MSRWLNYLANDRDDKRKRLYSLESGACTLQVTIAGDVRDITNEQIAKLKADVTEIEQILIENGRTIPDA